MVPVPDGPGTDIADVRAAARLGYPECGNLLPAQDWRDEALFLCLGPKGQDRRQRNAVRHQAGRQTA